MKIIKQIKLQYTDLINNNNKWWQGTLFEDGTTEISYARVGDNCSRPFYNKTWQQIEKKAAEKIREGYKEVKLNEIKIQFKDNNLDKRLENRINKIFSDANESLSQTSTVDVSNLSLDQLKAGKQILKDFSIDKSSDTLTEYFKLIPTKLPRKIDVSYEIQRVLQNLSNEEDRIEQLIAAVESNKILLDGGSLFDQLGSLLTENNNLQYFQDWIDKTSKHGYKYKVKEIWDINCIQEEHKDSIIQQIGNIKELFHSTKNKNVRHILRSGLIVPSYPSSGRLFGNGVYSSSICSKALNYSESYGEKYLFVLEKALGNVFTTNSYQSWNDVPNGYNSLYAPPGKIDGAWSNSILYDEYVVYNTKQQKLKHLLIIN